MLGRSATILWIVYPAKNCVLAQGSGANGTGKDSSRRARNWLALRPEERWWLLE